MTKPKPSLREEAIAWMRRSPHVLALFEEFGRQLVERRRRFGVNLLRERVRWETTFQYDDPLKVSNNYSPYVARHLLHVHPEWAPYVECKRTQEELDRGLEAPELIDLSLKEISCTS